MTIVLKTERVQILMSEDDVRRVDDWAFANRYRSRGEAIRRLIDLGLAATPTAPVPATLTEAE